MLENFHLGKITHYIVVEMILSTPINNYVPIHLMSMTTRLYFIVSLEALLLAAILVSYPDRFFPFVFGSEKSPPQYQRKQVDIIISKNQALQI